LTESILRPAREPFICQQDQRNSKNGRRRGARCETRKRSKSSLKGPSRQMAKSMSKKQLREFAKTKRKKLPRKKRR